MEKGKKACRHPPTLQDEQIKKILADALCDGIYDENIVREKVKRIDAYEGQIIICLVGEDEYKICRLC